MTLTLFALLAVLTLGGALGVALEPRIARVPLWLLGTFLGVAGIFLLSQAVPLGVTQLLVSVGGTLAILVYGLTQIAPKGDETPPPSMRSILAALVAVALLALVLLPPLWQYPPTSEAGSPPGALVIGAALLDQDAGTGEVPLANLPAESHLARPRTTYLLPLTVVLLHLLVVLGAAAYLTRNRGQEAQP
jgi:NADH:ubiquinone oxidoreductase subunit 6 (subunit J)